MLAGILALSLAAAHDAGSSSPFRNRPDQAPAQLALPKDSHPFLSNPQISVGGSKLYIARVAAPAPTPPLQNKLHISVIPLAPGGKPSGFDLDVPVMGSNVRLLLQPNEKNLAVLTAGQLWIRPLDPKPDSKPDAQPEARRLYPPAEGDAPLGPQLTHAVFARDSSWILVQSPQGWARVSVDDGAIGVLSMHPIDLSDGEIAMSPDDEHALFVKTQAGAGGGPAIAININTLFAQVLDSAHTYLDVLFLPDGKPLGVDADGALWILRPQERLPYFTPPEPKAGGKIGLYSIDLGLATVAWTVVRGGNGLGAKADLWSATPPLPPKPKSKEE